jgi:hypothetical protein
MKTEKIDHIIDLILSGRNEQLDEAQSYAEQRKNDVQEELQLLTDDQEEIKKLTDKLFPQGIVVDRQFYSTLSNAQYCFGSQVLAPLVLGKVWTTAYRRLTEADGQRLLELLSEFTHDIFSILPSLPEFLSRADLQEEFAASWLLSLGSKIANDLANGPFFDGVYQLVMHYPTKGLRLLEIYTRDKFEGFRAPIAVPILAAIRTCADKGQLSPSFVRSLEKDLGRHPNNLYRHAFNLSWIGYFRGGTVSADLLIGALNEMIQWTSSDVDDAFWIASRCILARRTDKQFLISGLQWVKTKPNHILTKGAKYALCDLAYQFRDIAKSGLGVGIAEIDELLLFIQPLTKEDTGALKLLDLYLATRLKQNKEEFKKLLIDILVYSSELLTDIIKEGKLAYLSNKLSGDYGSTLITDLLLSEQVNERRLGRALLEQMKEAKLDDAILSAKGSAKALTVLLFEIARMPFKAELMSQMFLLLLPFYESTEETLRNEFVGEMVFQGINYPGTCYRAWKDYPTPSTVLIEVLERVKSYFDALDSLRSCSGGQLTFPEWKSGLKEWERRFSIEVSEGAKKASVFASLIRHIDLIYGSEWSNANTSRLSDPTPMTTLSHSMEVPRLEVLDPEGCIMRRIRLNSLLKKLQMGYSHDSGNHE